MPQSTSSRSTPRQSPTQVVGPLVPKSPSLVTQLMSWVEEAIAHHVFAVGARLPSVRELAQTRGVSRFTVVEAYDRLVARGVLQARRGAGFFVCPPPTPLAAALAPAPHTTLDTVWLVRNMMQGQRAEKIAGYGYVAQHYMDETWRQRGLRHLSRQQTFTPQDAELAWGYLPLRETIQRQLAEHEIQAHPQQIVMTSGVTQAIDLVLRHFVRAGDCVITSDPAWFGVFGLLSLHDAKIIGAPYQSEGPDLVQLEKLIQRHRPKLLIVNSALHNPTGVSLSGACAYRLVRLAEQYDFWIVEDDSYAEFYPPHLAAARLAALDQLQRVIYTRSFSKTLASNIRVGFVAAALPLAEHFARLKTLSALSTPDLNERLVHFTLTEGRYRKNMDSLRAQLDRLRERGLRQLEGIGLRPFVRPQAGFFGWFDTGVDANVLTLEAQKVGFVLAPGALFSPQQKTSTWMRCNFSTCHHPAFLRWLEKGLRECAKDRT